MSSHSLDHGGANCGTLQANPAIVRDDPAGLDADEAAIYAAAGICPAGDVQRINDQYANLDTRVVEGIDVGVYYNLDSRIGNFDFRYIGSFLQKYEQEPGGAALVLLAAQENGTLPANYPVSGFDDLIRKDGNQDDRQSLAISWRKNDFGASTTVYRVGDFFQNSLTLADGTQYVIPSMTTVNATFDYTFHWGDTSARARLGVKNLTDERAPLADRFFGYFADAHRDLGRGYYLDIRLKF